MEDGWYDEQGAGMASIELKHYATEHGVKTALVRMSGPKWIHILIMEGPLHLRKVPATDTQFLSDVTFKGRPYPINRAVKTFRHYGRSHGTTTGAKMFLRQAKKQEKTGE